MMDVSVIMPAYNAEQYIAMALDSILSQKFNGSYEVLVADDKSSDSTKDIIESYQIRYPLIIKPVFRGKNLGVSKNYFQLTELASGKYLAFCDSDDLWIDENKLQKQVDFLNV